MIQITSMSAKTFKKVVEYLYTGAVENVSPNEVFQLLEASNLLGLQRLQQICEKIIQPLVSPENVIPFDIRILNTLGYCSVFSISISQCTTIDGM